MKPPGVAAAPKADGTLTGLGFESSVFRVKKVIRGALLGLAVFVMFCSAMFAASRMPLESAAYGVLASLAMAVLWHGRRTGGDLSAAEVADLPERERAQWFYDHRDSTLGE